MNHSVLFRSVGFCAAVGIALLAGGCAALNAKAPPHPSVYTLDVAAPAARTPLQAISAGSIAAPTLVVNPPRAAAGFDSPRMVYFRDPHKLEYFAHSEWVDTPARMLAPLIVAAVENGGAFRAVVPTSSAASGDLGLDTEILRLQQDFGAPPSQVRFTLRATLVDNATRRVLAWREFDETVAAASDDPYGGAIAAHRAVQTVLQQLAGFCDEAAAAWGTSAAAPERAEAR